MNGQNLFRRRDFGNLKLWQEVLLVISSLYVSGLVILSVTGNLLLFPTVALLGSFMVPAAFVAFFWDNRLKTQLTVSDIVLSFFYGGVLGVFLASIALPVFVQDLTLRSVFLAGFLEELAKILAVVAITRRLRHSSELNGIIIGAAVGMGFAALESTGYSFTVFLETGGSLSITVLLTLLRALIAPAGHGTWTAILAGILFRESAPYNFRITDKVILAYLGVSVLHGVWNGIPILTGDSPLSLILAVLGFLAVAAVGFFVLYRFWQEAKKRQFGA